MNISPIYKMESTTISPSNMVVGYEYIPADNRTLTGTLALDSAESVYQRIIRELAKRPILKHQCNSCGGTVEMDAEKHIFRCPYCGSTYAIGIFNLNDRGEDYERTD